MTVLIISIIGIILAIFGAAATLYHINRNPDGPAEALAGEYWWLAWPM